MSNSTTTFNPEYSSRQGWVGLMLISILGLISLLILRDPDHLGVMGLSGLVSMGVVGMWRWSWFCFQVIRGRFYLHFVFPRWRQQANAIAVEDLPHMCFVVPTFKEKPWITERVFKAIAKEAKTLARPITILVNSSGPEENAGVLKVLKSEDSDLQYINLILMVQRRGKRKAMADALRHLRTMNLPEDTIIALMDGDTELCPGTLRGCLPFFQLYPNLGALTTDELPIVEGSYIFSEWFHLRFAQRHYQMCCLSLSKKVLCLTGRFSLFRGKAALHPDFINQLEFDSLDDWLWGRFKFLSGDDKSTWFSLLKWGYDMIYIPDVMVYSLETHSGSVTQRAYANMKRWFGNMLRSNGRALSLGPKVTGWFPWWCLLDQRISMWTSLITPGLLLISLLLGKWLFVAVIISWVCFSRPLMLMIIFWGRESELKPIHFFILVATQWTSSVIKVWNQMNLAQQSWQNRGNQTVSAQASGWTRWIQVFTSRFLLFAQVFAFIVVLFWWWFGILTPVQDLESLWVKAQQPQPSAEVKIVDASDYGIYPNDHRDDAINLQGLIDDLPEQLPVQINLPIGELDLQKPLQIHRPNVTLKGEGSERTILQAHFNGFQQEAMIIVRGLKQEELKSLTNIKLEDFTLRQASNPVTSQPSQLNGIFLDYVADATVRNINLETLGNPVILSNTKNVTTEYITVRGTTVIPVSYPEDVEPEVEENLAQSLSDG